MGTELRDNGHQGRVCIAFISLVDCAYIDATLYFEGQSLATAKQGSSQEGLGYLAGYQSRLYSGTKVRSPVP